MTGSKRIPITDARAGEVRYSKPLLQHASRKPQSKGQELESDGEISAISEADARPTTMPEAVTAVAAEPMMGNEVQLAPVRPKVEIETLDQFIEYVYRKRGRPVTLNAKVERLIAQKPKLSDETQRRLMVLATEDVTLAVPRRLLLTAKEVRGYPGLRGALRGFVFDLLLGHPLFLQQGVEAAVRNLDDAPVAAEALRILATSEKSLLRHEQAAPMKDKAFKQLRVNAVHCLAVWIAESKGLSVAAIADALNVALWAPLAGRFKSDNAKLRALTELDEFGSVGLACEEYRRQAMEQLTQATASKSDATMLRERVMRLEAEVGQLAAAMAAMEAANSALRTSHEAALLTLKANAETEAAHLRDDLEKLRTRLLRRLKADVSLLESGLEALRRAEPKIHVMMDSAERVTDAIRGEIKNLQGGA